MRFFKPLVLFIVFSFLVAGCRVVKLEPVELLTFEEKLQTLFPEAEITKVETANHFSKAYKMIIEQPLDHENTAKGTIKQTVFLQYSSLNKPVNFVVENDSIYFKTYELSTILKGNQIQAISRITNLNNTTAEVKPFLTTKQAVEDYHYIARKLKTLYSGKWITSGKGNAATSVLVYRAIYPYDADMVLVYNASLKNNTADTLTEEELQKTVDFIENKGHKILYVYGENSVSLGDSPVLKSHVNALKMVLNNVENEAGIKNFSEEDKQRMYDKLQNWLGYSVTIYPLEN